jgi:hypothetical protein
VGTRTPDLYRVMFEVTHSKPFSSLAFPILLGSKILTKQPSFADELVTSFWNRNTRAWVVSLTGMFRQLSFRDTAKSMTSIDLPVSPT